MRIVLDTNVLVSGLLNPHGPPGRIVEMVISGRLRVLYDSRILAEYREVLSRLELGLDPDDRESVLGVLENLGEHVPIVEPLGVALPDPDDSPFLEVAFAARADSLVTGNIRHFPARQRRGVSVVTPRDFVTSYRA